MNWTKLAHYNNMAVFTSTLIYYYYIIRLITNADKMVVLMYSGPCLPVEACHQANGQCSQQQHMEVEAHQDSQANECDDKEEKGQVEEN